MTETWIERKHWDRLKNYLPEDFKWKCQHAEREKNKGRVIITRIRNDIMEESEGEDERITEGVQIRKIILKKDIWNLS